MEKRRQVKDKVFPAFLPARCSVFAGGGIAEAAVIFYPWSRFYNNLHGFTSVNDQLKAFGSVI